MARKQTRNVGGASKLSQLIESDWHDILSDRACRCTRFDHHVLG